MRAAETLEKLAVDANNLSDEPPDSFAELTIDGPDGWLTVQLS